MSLREGCYAAVVGNTGQGHTPISDPYGALISGCDAKIMLFSLWKHQCCQCGASKLVEARICPDPYAALSIDQHLPCGVGTESLLGCEAFPRRICRRDGRLPSLDVVESPYSSVGCRPKRAVGTESEVSELSIFTALFARWGWDDRSTRCVCHAAKPIVIRQPDCAIRGLMEKGVMRRRSQNESSGYRTSSIWKAMELGLTPGQKEKIAS
jgi:hypothetical protein